MTDITSKAEAVVSWIKREFATDDLIHGPNGERSAYSISLRTSGGPQRLVTLSRELLSDYTVEEVKSRLDAWHVAAVLDLRRERRRHRSSR